MSIAFVHSLDLSRKRKINKLIEEIEIACMRQVTARKQGSARILMQVNEIFSSHSHSRVGLLRERT